MKRSEIIDRIRYTDHCLIMGVLNVTEDSFSDGGRYIQVDKALEHARQMIRDGADIIDVGAESTRPGAIRVPEEVEKQRIVNVVKPLMEEFPDVAISVDTTRASVAQVACELGVHIINDVSGGQLDPELVRVVAQSDCLYIVQHWRVWLTAHAEQDTTHYEHGVTHDVYRELHEQVQKVIERGVDPQRIIIDPGLGFSKPTIDHNMPLILATSDFVQMGYPVLLGASRKRFIASMVAQAGHDDSEEARDDMTAYVTLLAAKRGAWAVRVHNVAKNKRAVQCIQCAQAYERDTDGTEK